MNKKAYLALFVLLTLLAFILFNNLDKKLFDKIDRVNKRQAVLISEAGIKEFVSRYFAQVQKKRLSVLSVMVDDDYSAYDKKFSNNYIVDKERKIEQLHSFFNENYNFTILGKTQSIDFDKKRNSANVEVVYKILTTKPFLYNKNIIGESVISAHKKFQLKRYLNGWKLKNESLIVQDEVIKFKEANSLKIEIIIPEKIFSGKEYKAILKIKNIENENIYATFKNRVLSQNKDIPEKIADSGMLEKSFQAYSDGRYEPISAKIFIYEKGALIGEATIVKYINLP